MILTGRGVLDDFISKHVDAKNWVNDWIADVEGSSWRNPSDIKATYSSVSFVGKVVIFNVKGNKYRMETKVAYNTGTVQVTWIGTHAAYDKRNEKVTR